MDSTRLPGSTKNKVRISKFQGFPRAILHKFPDNCPDNSQFIFAGFLHPKHFRPLPSSSTFPGHPTGDPRRDRWEDHFPYGARVKRLFPHRRGEERRESRRERRGEESRGDSREERTRAGKSVNALPDIGQAHLPISVC